MEYSRSHELRFIPKSIFRQEHLDIYKETLIKLDNEMNILEKSFMKAMNNLVEKDKESELNSLKDCLKPSETIKDILIELFCL